MHWWIADYLQSPNGLLFVLSWTFWVFFSISLHELAHGWAAIWEGDDTPIRMNRMTWNPIVHMGMTSIIVFLIIGIAWGLMPVNPRRFRHGAKGDALVAVAGPVMNLLLAFLAASAWLVVVLVTERGAEYGLRDKVMLFLEIGAQLNMVLLLLNLLPIPPLDGSKVLAGLWRPAARFYAQPEVGQYSFFALMAVFFFGGSEALFKWAGIAVAWFLNTGQALFR